MAASCDRDCDVGETRLRRGPRRSPPNDKTDAGVDGCEAVDRLRSSMPSNEKATASSVRLSHAQQERFRAADSNQ